MGMRLESEALKLLMNEYDLDGSGQIDLDEFEGMIRLGWKFEAVLLCAR